MKTIKIKKLLSNAVIPSLPREGDAGIDLTAAASNHTAEYIEYDTGLAISVPKDHVGLLFPRSSVTNKDIFLGNGVGVLDESYLGPVTLRFKRVHEELVNGYKIGDRIGQLIVIPLPKYEIKEVEELEETARGTGGYGSTGS